MSEPLRTVALIVAAGSGSRVGGDLPKQFRRVLGQPMLRHSYAALSAHPDISDVYVAVGESQESMALDSLNGLPSPHLVVGGATRRESVNNGLAAIAADGGARRVLIHDAARPFLAEKLIDDLLAALDEAPGAVPALPVVDSLARGDGALMDTVERDGLWPPIVPSVVLAESLSGRPRTDA